MIFITRELYDGWQEKSGWTRTATAKTARNFKLYRRYLRLIRPFLPDSAIRFSKFSFHDAEVVACSCGGGKLKLVLDTAGVFAPLPARYAHITFKGVRQSPFPMPRKKEWWFYSEVHLGSRSKFCLHVMFTQTDVEISADEVGVIFKNDKS